MQSMLDDLYRQDSRPEKIGSGWISNPARKNQGASFLIGTLVSCVAQVPDHAEIILNHHFPGIPPQELVSCFNLSAEADRVSPHFQNAICQLLRMSVGVIGD